MKKVGSTFAGMSLSLTLICLVFTGLMATVYDITLEPIAEAGKAKQQNAIKAVQNDFDEMVTDTVTVDGKTYPVFKTYKAGKWNGTAVESTANGYGGEIKVMIGFDNQDNVVDFQVLSHSETPGLGAKMDQWFKDPKHTVNRRHLENETLKVNKDGGDIDAITAATITSRAFLNSVNDAYKAYTRTKNN